MKQIGMHSGHAESAITVRGFEAKELLAITIRRRAIILAVFLPITLLAIVATLRASNVVTASSRVLIETTQPDQLAYRPSSADYTEILATAAQIGMSIPVADKAAAAIIDSLPGIEAVEPEFKAPTSEADVRDMILAGVDCSPVGESRILRIACSNASPRFSVMAVGAVMEAFIDYSVESVKNPRALSYYDEQISAVQAEIDSLMLSRANVLNASGYSSFRITAQASANYSGVVDQDFQKARSRRLGVEAHLEGFRAALKDNPDFVPMTDGNTYNLMTELRRSVDEARFRLADLQTKYQDDYGLVVRQKEMVKVAEQAMRQGQQNYIHDMEIQLAEAKQVEASLQAAMKEQLTALDSFPEVERKVESINLQIDARRDLLKTLQIKRGEVRLRADTDRRISNVIPLNMPTLELAVAGSKKFLYLALASVFALALGVMAALVVENQDHRLYNRRQIEQYLQVPVVGVVSDEPGSRR